MSRPIYKVVNIVNKVSKYSCVCVFRNLCLAAWCVELLLFCMDFIVDLGYMSQEHHVRALFYGTTPGRSTLSFICLFDIYCLPSTSLVVFGSGHLKLERPWL